MRGLDPRTYRKKRSKGWVAGSNPPITIEKMSLHPALQRACAKGATQRPQRGLLLCDAPGYGRSGCRRRFEPVALAVPVWNFPSPDWSLRILYRSLARSADDQRVLQCSHGCGDRLAARPTLLRQPPHRRSACDPAANRSRARLLKSRTRQQRARLPAAARFIYLMPCRLVLNRSRHHDLR
jgi:hypothetical protein